MFSSDGTDRQRAVGALLLVEAFANIRQITHGLFGKSFEITFVDEALQAMGAAMGKKGA